MTFTIRFLICNIFISLMLAFLLLFKRVLKKHITLGTQYRLWYVFLLILILPLIPHGILFPRNLFSFVQNPFSKDGVLSVTKEIAPASSILTDNPGLTDFSDAASFAGVRLNRVLWGIWITGIIAASLYLLYAAVKIRCLRKNASPVVPDAEPDLYRIFSGCLEQLHIRRKIHLYASCTLTTPISYGWLQPTVIIPEDLDIYLSEKDIRHIFLHELLHCKQGDTLLNEVLCFLQIFYWFNPFVRYGFQQLREDQEIACDYYVIRTIGANRRGDYGDTILQYVRQVQKGRFMSPLSGIGGNHFAIRRRITEIACYCIPSTRQKIKSAGIFLLALIFTCYASPLLAAYALPQNTSDLNGKNWESIDVSQYFHEMNGSFVLYDLTADQYFVYNSKKCVQRVSPDSTYKIYSALIALEEGVITPDQTLLQWNKTEQKFDSWEQNHTLSSAMKDSVNWYFQSLDAQSGLSVLSSYFQKISYGNCDLSGGLDNYWMESSLKISPLEQASLLADLVQNTWGFDAQNIEAVKNALFISDTDYGTLYGKTGTGSVNNLNENGWFTGFLDTRERILCFAVNLQGENASGAAAYEITVKILENEQSFKQHSHLKTNGIYFL